ncbi:hypothetical protein [uncultured Limosilactobacillus sp.]|uniref:hypothetical protein n=1 Tax=uncultured Limosilactobacillus sp. TaxID=2837629 RepID=UPI0025D06F6B|nr:hypothetical protein [uncultured Limosilactobacillus sp.]
MAKHNASTAQDYNQKGIKLAATGNPKEAFEQFNQAVSLNYSPLYFGNRGMIQFAGMPTAGEDRKHTMEVHPARTADDFMVAALLLFERYSEVNAKDPVTKGQAATWGAGIMTYLYGAGCMMFIENNPLVKPTSEDYYAVDYFKNYMISFVTEKDAAQTFNSWIDMDKAFVTFLAKMAEDNHDKQPVFDQMTNVALLYAKRLKDPEYLKAAREDVKQVLGHGNRVDELRVMDRTLFGNTHKDDELFFNPEN